MHDEQIRLGRDGEFHRGQAGIYGRGDFCDRARIFHLQPVHRAVVIADLAYAKNSVTVGNDGFERDFRHGAMKANFPLTAKSEVFDKK